MKLAPSAWILITGILLGGAKPPRVFAEPMTRAQILEIGDSVADAQLKSPPKKDAIDWVAGVWYAGLADYSHVSPKGAEYSAALKSLVERKEGVLRSTPKLPFMADDFCIGQAFLDVLAHEPNSPLLAPLKSRCDALVEHIDAEGADAEKITWYWCDALFMAPPTLTRLSSVTGNRKYLDAMDREYWRTAALLYDPKNHLFFRDAKYLTKLDRNNKPTFWSRGDGWVVGGLVRVLREMPANYPSRPKYITLFKDMMTRLAPLQAADGTWPSNLVDPDDFPGPEMSGTSFYTYAAAWGVNNNLLDRHTFLPVIEKGWAAMLAARRADGLPGFVQGVGKEPGHARAQGTQLYASGAYLMTACELLHLAPLEMPPLPKLAEGALPPGVKLAPEKDDSTAESPTTEPDKTAKP